MSIPPVASPVEVELNRIRELSRHGKHLDALAAAELLAAAAPSNRDALYLIAANQRCLSRIPDALATLQRLEQQHPRFSLLHQERGFCYVMMRDSPRGIAAFQHAVTINEALLTSWIMLERLYHTTGDSENASTAAEQIAALRHLPAEVLRAGSLFADRDFSAAEHVLRTYLRDSGEQVEAIRLLARLERQRNALDDAQSRLEAALARFPESRATRLEYVRVLVDQQKHRRAREELDTLIGGEAGDRECVSLDAAVSAGLGDHHRAITLYRQLLAASPGSSEAHISLGHVFRAVGRQEEAIASYQAAAALRPDFGDAYWSLANLKTYRFSQEEIARMRAAEGAPATHAVDRWHLCFALGKAFEDRGEFQDSWRFYERGNALKRAESPYDPNLVETNVREQIEVCSAEFFTARQGVGTTRPDPILIVGLPRSGSTLIEQILASHSQVDGTHELPDIPRMARALQARTPEPSEPSYRGLAALAPEEFQGLGERYLADTRIYRTGRPFFLDKMPNNFRHIGLIQLMLPRATIIDVRREPMACCFSNFKQLFAGGQDFTYSVDDIAHYYRTYLELMRHWDAVLPGRVLRVWYEDLLDNLEPQVRRILDFCGLDFEPACVEFYKTDRIVQTASSEQVRQPISRGGLSQWRHYERWLDPLKHRLADALTRYRE